MFLLFFFDHQQKVFYRQSRIGKNAKPFNIIKLKTMTDEKGEDGRLLPDEQRLTSIGRFIRSTSLDELPQLWNVMKGDMSLVGPRPLLEKYIPLYSKEQFRRHEVKPGITGWAQVNGRNNISWAEKFELDVWYVDNQSFWLDMKILWLTLIKVVKRKDITPEDPQSFQPFNGHN
jgi:lipopolysaccharide/colanic/teichoic acid biosynthesis glycosyltransferase